MNLSRIVERNAADRGASVAIEIGDRSITFAELAREVHASAAALAGLGIGRGDRVGWLGCNSPRMLALLFALAKLGAILVPLNFRLALPEHRYILGHAGVHLLFAESDFVDLLQPLADELATSRGPAPGTGARAERRTRAGEAQGARAGLGPGARAEAAPGARTGGRNARLRLVAVDGLWDGGGSGGGAGGDGVRGLGPDDGGGSGASSPRGWLSWDAVRAAHRAPPAEHGTDADPVLIAYTAGTTGRPKGVVLTQSNLLWNAFNSVHVHEMTSADRVLANLPMFQVGGLNIQTLPALYAGARVCLQRTFDAGQALALVESFRPTLSLVVPATLRALIEHPRFAQTDLSSLRLLMTGSMCTPGPLIEAMHARGVPVGQVYGATETASVAICLRREDALRKVGFAGRPAPHTEVRLTRSDGSEAGVGDEGEIWVRGPHVMREYWDDPQTTAATMVGDWFRSGDTGVADQEGFIRVVGRIGDGKVQRRASVLPG